MREIDTRIKEGVFLPLAWRCRPPRGWATAIRLPENFVRRPREYGRLGCACAAQTSVNLARRFAINQAILPAGRKLRCFCLPIPQKGRARQTGTARPPPGRLRSIMIAVAYAPRRRTNTRYLRGC